MLLPLRFRSAILLGLSILLISLVMMGSGGFPEGEVNSSDVPFLAERDGITHEEAESLYGWQDDFTVVLMDIMESHASNYSSASVDGRVITVSFASNIPADAQQALDSFSENHGVTIITRSGVGFAQADLKSAMKAVHRAVQDVAGVRIALTSMHDSGLISTQVKYGGEVTQSITDTISGKANEALSGRSSNIRVSVAVQKDDGGEYIKPASSSEHMGDERITGCTSSFAVKPSSGSGAHGHHDCRTLP